MLSDDEYSCVSSIETSDGFGVRVFVRRPSEVIERIKALDDERQLPGEYQTAREKERNLLNGEAERLYKTLRLQAAALDPAVKAQHDEVLEALGAAFKRAGFQPIFFDPIPNEYWPAGDSMALQPWYMVTTTAGHFKCGWRKRVIVLDWSRTTVAKTADELFSGEVGVTKGGRMIHCWGYESLRSYLKVLHDVFAAGEVA